MCPFCASSMTWFQLGSTLDLHGSKFQILIRKVSIMRRTPQAHVRMPWDGVCVRKFCLTLESCVIKAPFIEHEHSLTEHEVLFLTQPREVASIIPFYL